jgi:hypothetical protein
MMTFYRSINLYEGSSTLTSKYVNASGDTMSGSASGGLLSATNTNTGGAGVAGYCYASGGSGVLGQGASSGVWGYSSSPGDGVRGIYGQATNAGAYQNYGGYFTAAGATGVGVFGEASGSSGHAVSNYASGANGYGVYSYASGTNGRGVYGIASNSGAVTNYGGYFTASGTTGRGVYGRSSNASGRNYGGYFEASGGDGRGVYGNGDARGGYFRSNGVSGDGVFGYGGGTGTYNPFNFSFYDYTKGGFFQAAGDFGIGVMAECFSDGSDDTYHLRTYAGYFHEDGNYNGIGVYAHTESGYAGLIASSGTSGDYAGRFNGDVAIIGNLTKSSGAFKIDHPMYPDTKYLNHSFLESPDMKNVYDGTEIPWMTWARHGLSYPRILSPLIKISATSSPASVDSPKSILQRRFKTTGSR